jgi:hypothetical protein
MTTNRKAYFKNSTDITALTQQVNQLSVQMTNTMEILGAFQSNINLRVSTAEAVAGSALLSQEEITSRLDEQKKAIVKLIGPEGVLFNAISLPLASNFIYNTAGMYYDVTPTG